MGNPPKKKKSLVTRFLNQLEKTEELEEENATLRTELEKALKGEDSETDNDETGTETAVDNGLDTE